jgi:DNA processing protein
VECAGDILQDLGVALPASTGDGGEMPAREIDPLLETMGFTAQSIDELAQRTGLEAATLAARLTRFEIDGTVQSIPGARFQRMK